VVLSTTEVKAVATSTPSSTTSRVVSAAYNVQSLKADADFAPFEMLQPTISTPGTAGSPTTRLGPVAPMPSTAAVTYKGSFSPTPKTPLPGSGLAVALCWLG
jgi:hypothetical protein